MTKISSLCVFCGSKTGEGPAFEAAARRLGSAFSLSRSALRDALGASVRRRFRRLRRARAAALALTRARARARARALALALALARELLTNAHAFVMIVTNHAGSDLYRFEAGCRFASGTFYLRQVIS